MFQSRPANVALAAVVTFTPLLGAPDRMMHPGPWIAFLGGCATLLTQPPLGPKQMVHDVKDRATGLGIYVAVIAAQVVALVDFGYRPALSPAADSAEVVVGACLAAAGLGFRVWAIRILGQFFTSTVQVQRDQRVIAVGPYALIRHPSYSGSLLFNLATCLALGSVLGAVLVIGIVLPAYLYRIRVEEKALREGLGPEYESYMSRTKRLVPYLI